MSQKNPKLNSRVRNYKDGIEVLGAKILGWSITGKNHTKFKLEMPDGTIKAVVTPCSDGDVRGVKNKLAEVRRLVIQHSARA